MSESDGPYQALETYVHLGPNGTSFPLPVTANFWQQLTSGAFAHLGAGRLVSCYEFSENWATWERHPAGEEAVVLVSGALEFVLSTESGDTIIAMSKPGQFLIVPRGTWHTANVSRRAMALFITAGEGTENRPRSG